MSFIKYRVRVLEPFKDGNVLEGRLLKPEDVVVLDEQDFQKIVNSGGKLEIVDNLVPNPLKSVDPKPVEPAEVEEVQPAPEPKRRGRRAAK